MSWDLARATATYDSLLKALAEAAPSVKSLFDRIASWVPDKIAAQYGADAGITVQVLRTCRSLFEAIIQKVGAAPAILSAEEGLWLKNAVSLWKALVMGVDLQSKDPDLEVGVAPAVVVLGVGVSVTVAGLCFAIVVKDVAIVLRDWLSYLNRELAARTEAMRTGRTLPPSTAPGAGMGAGVGAGAVVGLGAVAATLGVVWWLNQKK